MKMLTFLLEMIIVLAIIVFLYQAYFNTTKSGTTGNNEELITEDFKDMLNDVSDKYSLNNKKTEEKIENRINSLMKKYNIGEKKNEKN